MKNFQGATLQLTTDYLGGFVYENGVLKFFGSPEGRVVKNGSAFQYQYSITDHQGNTRVVFTSATPTPLAPMAPFEGDSNEGVSQHQNIVAGNVVSFVAANHTTAYKAETFDSVNEFLKKIRSLENGKVVIQNKT